MDENFKSLLEEVRNKFPDQKVDFVYTEKPSGFSVYYVYLNNKNMRIGLPKEELEEEFSSMFKLNLYEQIKSIICKNIQAILEQ